MANAKIRTIQIKPRNQLSAQPNAATTPIRSSTIEKRAKTRKGQTLKPTSNNIKRKRRSPIVRNTIQSMFTVSPRKFKKSKSKAGTTRPSRCTPLSSVSKKLIIVNSNNNNNNNNNNNKNKNNKKNVEQRGKKAQKSHCQLPRQASVGADARYSNGQPGKLSRRQSIGAGSPAQSLLAPPSSVGVVAQKSETPNGYGYGMAYPIRSAPRPDNLIVPLSSRLPIIDFISTDEFERLRNCKMKQKKIVKKVKSKTF